MGILSRAFLVPVLRCVSVPALLLSARSESSQMASFLGFPRVGNLTLYVTLYDCLFLKPRVSYDDIRLLIEKHDHSLISIDLQSPAPCLEPEPDSSHWRLS